MKKIVIHRISCQVCGEIFAALSLKKVKRVHQQHIKKCKIIRFWEKANRILGRELTYKEVTGLLGIRIKLKS